jgi:hypothetical protein
VNPHRHYLRPYQFPSNRSNKDICGDEEAVSPSPSERRLSLVILSTSSRGPCCFWAAAIESAVEDGVNASFYCSDSRIAPALITGCEGMGCSVCCAPRHCPFPLSRTALRCCFRRGP